MNAITLYVLVQNSVLEPIMSQSSPWISLLESHLAAMSLSISIMVLLLLVFVTDQSFPSGIPMSVSIFLSSVFNCKKSKCENFKFFIPLIANCLALMPSLAATPVFACAGGLMSTEAYEFVGSLVWLIGVVRFVVVICIIFYSKVLMCVSIFSFASSIKIFMSDVNSIIWLSNTSLTIRLICVSSSSSSRNATDLIVLITGFCKPDIAEI